MADSYMRIVWFLLAQMTIVYPYNNDVGCTAMLNYLVKPGKTTWLSKRNDKLRRQTSYYHPHSLPYSKYLYSI